VSSARAQPSPQRGPKRKSPSDIRRAERRASAHAGRSREEWVEEWKDAYLTFVGDGVLPGRNDRIEGRRDRVLDAEEGRRSG
jgi:hypothetical protein